MKVEVKVHGPRDSSITVLMMTNLGGHSLLSDHADIREEMCRRIRDAVHDALEVAALRRAQYEV